MLTSKRMQLKKLEREVKKTIGDPAHDVRIFVWEDDLCNRGLSNTGEEWFHDLDGNRMKYRDIHDLKKTGVKCFCVVPGELYGEPRDLNKLSAEELEQLENIIVKMEGRDVSAAAAVKAVL